MSGSVAALRALRTQCLEAAERFSDYNFRTYFVKHTADTFDAVEAKGGDAVSAFLDKEGKERLAQLQRMSTVDQLYNHVPVIIDPKRQQ
eukprot:CAMPEP_0174828828 /NCGR_PEP_ID=MMETSP1114-20130205/1561_1 /TAXON_ID=312471 /ORGANISM="Neobodo designis, Strain CCAP 1951/1" /LENGTH=88 /DNA_ID=CAMNT_0016062555 /DNA_START=32 /DNA_END=298 /DNA_ORIENTATION=-